MENIQVCLRVRPQHNAEVEANDPDIWQVPQADMITVNSEKQQELFRSKKFGGSGRNDFSYSTTRPSALSYLTC